jgi:drug/metabolite transporter (DMT)-like permease
VSPFGLLLATAMSVTNVLTDVARKHALEKRDLVPATFWMRVGVTICFGIALLWQVLAGKPVVIRDGGPLFGIESWHVDPVPTFLVYLVLDVGLITCVMWLYFRALQISPLSMCVPFLAFTPVFLIPSSYFLIGEKVAPMKLLGVLLIVVGSLVMHRKLFALGWMAPVKAIIQEKGSRYMLLVSMIFSLTNPLDKKLVVMSDVFTEAFSYGLGLIVSFYLLGRLQKADFGAAIRGNVKWVSLAALSDAVSLLFQLASYAYVQVAIVVSIKRAGIILSVAAGWLFFHERGITDKVIAAAVMFSGVLILYLNLTFTGALVLMASALVAMSVALYATREKPVEVAR